MVLLSVTLDFIQEHRAGKAAESLRHSVSLRARVIRDGKSIEVPVTEVVPGDLAELSAGDMVPADGLVLITRCTAHGEETGDRQASGFHHGPGVDGCSLYG